MLKITYLLLLQFLITNYAFAYADPGAGAFILQAIIAFLGVIVFYLGYPIRIIKSLFNKKKNKDKDNNEHSEDKKSQ